MAAHPISSIPPKHQPEFKAQQFRQVSNSERTSFQANSTPSFELRGQVSNSQGKFRSQVSNSARPHQPLSFPRRGPSSPVEHAPREDGETEGQPSPAGAATASSR